MFSGTTKAKSYPERAQKGKIQGEGYNSGLFTVRTAPRVGELPGNMFSYLLMKRPESDPLTQVVRDPTQKGK